MLPLTLHKLTGMSQSAFAVQTIKKCPLYPQYLAVVLLSKRSNVAAQIPYLCFRTLSPRTRFVHVNMCISLILKVSK